MFFFKRREIVIFLLFLVCFLSVIFNLSVYLELFFLTLLLVFTLYELRSKKIEQRKGKDESGEKNNIQKILEREFNINLQDGAFSEKEFFIQVSQIFNLIEEVTKGQSFGEVFYYLYTHFRMFFPYDILILALKDTTQNIFRIEMYKTELDINIPKDIEFPVSDSLVKLFPDKHIKIVDIDSDIPELKVLSKYNLKSFLGLPIFLNEQLIGILFFASKKEGIYEKLEIPLMDKISNLISQSFQKCIYMDELITASLIGLAKLAEYRDTDTGAHLERMSNYSRIIAAQLSKTPKYQYIIDDDYVRDIYNYSPLHDIGKVGIPDNILLKPGKLTDEEWKIMKRHTTYGAEVLRKADEHLQQKGKSLFFIGIQIAESHHEKWDGSGYPYGLKGDQIPLSARIVAVADVFDALTSKRCYKEPFSFDESVKIIKEGKGKHFDPDVVDAFLESIDKIKAIYDTFKGK